MNRVLRINLPAISARAARSGTLVASDHLQQLDSARRNAGRKSSAGVTASPGQPLWIGPSATKCWSRQFQRTRPKTSVERAPTS